ncbi:MAG TPA: metal ABC transporter substrate-binding protein [Tepidisphaeraceae bacterium]|nr:metal ABC transporter substrate-binding protein [Tepidisphaeraceae bacterium]
MRWTGLLILGLVFIGACDGPPPAPAQRKLNILATVYPLGDMARQIGGDAVEVTWIVESGQSIGNISATGEVHDRLNSADLVLTGGATEPWATQGFSDPFQHGRLVRLDVLQSAREQTDGGLLWLDPVIMHEACRELGARLQVLRSDNYSEFQKRMDDYSAQIDATFQPYQRKLLAPQQRKLIVLSSDFLPFLKRLGLEGINSVSARPTDLDDSDIRRLKQVAQQEKTTLLILPADIPAIVVQDIEHRSGLQAVVLDALGSSAGGGRNTYLDLLKFNLEQLLRATTIQ